jgi:hypothetical protein
MGREIYISDFHLMKHSLQLLELSCLYCLEKIKIKMFA